MSLFGRTSRRRDPMLGHSFLVTLVDSTSSMALSKSDVMAAINRRATAGFSECTGLESELEIEEYREGGRNGEVLKFPTRNKWSNIVLKQGVGVGGDLWAWYRGFVEGRGRRRDGIVALLDERQFPMTVWTFRRGLPAKYVGPAFNAAQSSVAIETLEIAHEGLAMFDNADNPASGMLDLGALKEVF